MKTRILIIVASLAILVGVIANAQDRIVTGTVTANGDGSPITGATISLKGANRGTTTDKDGKYAIKISSEKDILVFSFVGYVPQEIKVKGKSLINVKLAETMQHLEEVIMTSPAIYGSRRPIPEEKKSKIYSNSPLAQPAGMPVPQRSYDAQPIDKEANSEEYKSEKEIGFKATNKDPQTTFSIDVDRAAYANVRRFLINNGQMPPKDAVRIEEMINYFDYNYAQPMGKDPIAVHTEMTDSPWNKGLKLLHIGLQAKTIPTDNLPASNLVFLIDVSGSMNDPNKLPLLKAAFKLLVDQLREQDKVAIVVYAGAAGLVLPSTSGKDKSKIKDALDNLSAGGSTAGGAGVQLAYKTAIDNLVKNGNNRVILATDGDFNVGVSSSDELEKLIEAKRKSGVFLSVLGFGMGNYKDAKMEVLADKGNGNYAYIDNLMEAEKIFVKEFGGTLFTVAKDVKLQLEFNPKYVAAYRLIGYENRALANEDFKNDAKDAGEMGSGHTVTAIYEIVPAGTESAYLADKLKYQTFLQTSASNSDEVCTVKIRYKLPEKEVSTQMEISVKDKHTKLAETSENMRFAMAVAEFGLLLRESNFKGTANYDQILDLAKNAKGKDDEGYRAEFLKLVKIAKMLENR
jgi:Ca-activated chloride channel homolog